MKSLGVTRNGFREKRRIAFFKSWENPPDRLNEVEQIEQTEDVTSIFDCISKVCGNNSKERESLSETSGVQMISAAKLDVRHSMKKQEECRKKKDGQVKRLKQVKKNIKSISNDF